MSSAVAGWLQLGALVLALAICYVPLGNWMARIFTSERHWRVETGIYRVIGVNPDADSKIAITHEAASVKSGKGALSWSYEITPKIVRVLSWPVVPNGAFAIMSGAYAAATTQRNPMLPVDESGVSALRADTR